MAKLNFDLVRHALQTARESGFTDVQLQVGDDSFTASLSPARSRIRVPREGDSEPTEPSGLVDISAQQVGYYRLGKKPLEVGQQVEKGDQVAIIAALGIANDIEAPAGGEVVEVLVEQDQPVQYGQVLARIKP